MGLYTFSFSADDSKSSFFAGESDILRVSSADAACVRVSGRVDMIGDGCATDALGWCQLDRRHCVWKTKVKS